MNTRFFLRKLSIQKAFISISIISVTLLILGAILMPDAIRSIAREDGLLENLTAGILLGSFFYGIRATIRIKTKAHQKASLVITTLALIGFLDEISFGARIFNLKAISVNGNYIDGVHDVVEITKKAAFQNNSNLSTALILFALAALGLILRNNIQQSIRYLVTNKLATVSAVVAAAATFAQLLDVKLIGSYISTPLEETLELIASIGLATILIVLDSKKLRTGPKQ